MLKFPTGFQIEAENYIDIEDELIEYYFKKKQYEYHNLNIFSSGEN